MAWVGDEEQYVQAGESLFQFTWATLIGCFADLDAALGEVAWCLFRVAVDQDDVITWQQLGEVIAGAAAQAARSWKDADRHCVKSMSLSKGWVRRISS